MSTTRKPLPHKDFTDRATDNGTFGRSRRSSVAPVCGQVQVYYLEGVVGQSWGVRIFYVLPSPGQDWRVRRLQRALKGRMAGSCGKC
jgi:hypothetical protein